MSGSTLGIGGNTPRAGDGGSNLVEFGGLRGAVLGFWWGSDVVAD
jgi:hypothetical protein